MEKQLVRIDEVFSDLTEVERLVLGKLADVFDPWYAITDTGDVDEEKTSKKFAGWREAHPALFPMMCRQDVKNDGVRHEAPMDIGGVHFYGGSQANFDPTARIKGPFWAGEECTVRTGAYVNTSSMIGSRTVISRRVDVSASFIRGRTQIDAFAMVNHSLIGKNVYVGPGAKLLHKPLRAKIISTLDYRDRGPAKVFSTERSKFGAVVGDDCFIDADAKLFPGTVLLPGCVVPANAKVVAGIYTKELIEEHYGRARP